MLAFLGLGKLQAIALGVLVVLLLGAGGVVYVQTLRLENSKAREASLKRDVAEAVRANQSLVDQVAAERSALALARDLAAEHRAYRDALQAHLDTLDKQIREAPRAVVPEQCRAICRDACRADPGVWRSITGPGGVRPNP